jgi:hypothetical protein
LPPGKPAGVHAAQQLSRTGFYLLLGAGLIGTGIAIAESSGHSTITTTATSTTSP